MKPFRGRDKPNIIDVAFGWYHEAYIDGLGKLYVCKKPKQFSIRVEGIDDKDRPDLVEVTSIQDPIKQASFTRQRMFVLTEKGEVFVFKIKEKMSEMDMEYYGGTRRLEISGEVDLSNPLKVKGLQNIKMISTGADHFLALSYEGLVYAMGDDTFG